MKKSLLAALMLVSGAASADFSGAYDFANWTQSLDGGAIVTTGGPTILSMVSSDDGAGPDYTDFTINAMTAGTVSFDWGYQNGDKDGSFWDPFGYLVGGVFTQLSPNTNAMGVAGGHASFAVAAGQSFGFRIFALDSDMGSSYASVYNFSAPVPEPETYAMMLAGIAMLGAVVRRRRA